MPQPQKSVAEQEAACPVRHGDIWRVGAHLFGCGDIEEGSVLAALLALAAPLTLVYADPPWTSANATTYRAMSGRERARKADWRSVFARALTPARDRKLLCDTEMGWNPRGEAMRLARGMGAACPWWEPVKYPWTTSVIFAADFRDPPGQPTAHITGAHGWQSDAQWLTSGHAEPSAQALAAHAPGVVLDPCCGEGYTSRSAVTAGWTFVGHEITARRLWNGISRIAQLTGSSPERISQV
jgi:hypothetical protein